MTESELKLLAGRLRLATQARDPWHFFFFRQGADGDPVMEVHRKAADAKIARKRARAAAKKKEPFYASRSWTRNRSSRRRPSTGTWS